MTNLDSQSVQTQPVDQGIRGPPGEPAPPSMAAVMDLIQKIRSDVDTIKSDIATIKSDMKSDKVMQNKRLINNALFNVHGLDTVILPMGTVQPYIRQARDFAVLTREELLERVKDLSGMEEGDLEFVNWTERELGAVLRSLLGIPAVFPFL